MAGQMLRAVLPYFLIALLSACGGGGDDGGDAAGIADRPPVEDVGEPTVPPADPDPLDLPLRAIHASGNWATNRDVVDNWNAGGRREPLVPLDHIEYLHGLRVNWVGFSVALHYDDSLDSTVERVYSDVDVPTFADDALRQIIRELRAAGFGVYLTLAFEAFEAEESARPVRRWQLGDSGHADTGVPPDDPDEFGRIRQENWPWRPDHPDHDRFVAEFWETYTDQAVHFARIAEEEGVRLYSLGTETDRLFRTRSGGYWPNHFREELQAMVRRVREVYSGASPTTCTTPSSRLRIFSGRGRTFCGKTWTWTWWVSAHGSPWCPRRLPVQPAATPCKAIGNGFFANT